MTNAKPTHPSGELVNVRVEGTVYRNYEPKRNAVILDLVSDRNEFMADKRRLTWITTIECKDEDLLPLLKREAELLLRTLKDW